MKSYIYGLIDAVVSDVTEKKYYGQGQSRLLYT